MFFENFTIAPLLLVALVALVVLAVLFERRRFRLLGGFFAPSEWAAKLPLYQPRAAWWRLISFVAALSLIGVALLKPYSGFEMHEISRKGIDVYLLVDLSESMRAQDMKPSRMERARHEIRDLLGILRGDRIGLIGFAGEAFVFVPLTSDYAAYGLFLDELSPDAIPVQGTDIKGAIRKSLESFQKQSKTASKALILMTDGEDSVGLDPSVIEQIQKNNIKTYVVGIGTPEGAPIPLPDGGYKKDQGGETVITRLNETVLQDLARQTGGGYVRSVSGDLDLQQIYERGIKKAFADEDLAKTQKKLPLYTFQIFLLPAILLLMLESLTTNRKRYWLSQFLRRKTTLVACVLAVALAASFPSWALNPLALEKPDKLFKEQKYDEALQEYLKLAQKDPDDAHLQYNLGETYFRLKKYEEAERAYKIGLNASDPELRKQALYNLGNTAFRRQKLEEALAYYEKALQIDKNYQKAQLNYDFVKKLLEQQKQEQEQDQQKQDQQQNQQDQGQQNQDQQQQGQQDQQEQDQQNSQDEGQKQENQGGQKPEDENKQGGQQQEDQKEGEPKPDQSGSDSSQDEQKSEEKKGGDGAPEHDTAQEQGSVGGTEQGSAAPGQFDQNADQWLGAIQDDPSGALKRMIEKKSTADPQRLDKDW